MSDSVLACFTFCYNIRTLAIEDVPADSLAYGHAQIDIQTNASDADASIIFILRQQESVVVMMVMVRMASMCTALCGCHSSGNVSFAVRSRAPIE